MLENPACCHESQRTKVGRFFVLLSWQSTKPVFRENDTTMCINIYDVRLDDTSPACGMNWPPGMPAVKKMLAVMIFIIAYFNGSSRLT
jgi:carboxypeptidase C (cathepsin A)